MHTSYYYLVTYYLNPVSLLKRPVWTSASVPIFGSMSNLVSESFFARRVYMIGPQYRIVVLSAMLMILASCGLFITVSVHALATSDLIVSVDTESAWLPTAGSALLFAGDVQLTAVLVYFLHKSRTGVKRTNSMVDLLIAYTISTGSLICVLNVVSLVLSVLYQHNIIYTAATLVVQAVYTNSFVVALNTRQFVRSRGELDHTDIGGGLVLGEKPSPGSDPVKTDVAFPSVTLLFLTGRWQFITDGKASPRSSLPQDLRGRR
ncbi:hypothetical protein C8Q79DRAFT_40983 [Trametes meyenii]|nr:hypothetical protein C8Q79DRAFT_40983 [Trametes meyenii]